MRDPLVDQLVGQLTAKPPLKDTHLWLGALACYLIACLSVLTLMGLRADYLQALNSGALLWKPAIFMGMGLSSLVLITRLSRPHGRAHMVHGLGGMFALALLISLFSQQYSVADSGWFIKAFSASMSVSNGVICAVIIIVAGAGVMALVWQRWLKHSASSHPQAMGALAGLGAGSLVSAAFTWHCAMDAIPYIVVYYLFPIGLLAFVGFVLGKRLSW